MTHALATSPHPRPVVLYTALAFLATLLFSVLFALVNYANYTWLSPLFERQTNPTVWGLIQRAYLILPCAVIAVWRPRQLGFQIGKIRRYALMLALMLVANVLVVGGYTLLAGGTPYSGLNMLFNEAVTVPLVEEVVWRGVVFAALLAALRRFLPEDRAAMLSGLFSGICFGLLHANNAFFGYPLSFVALQTLNATVWGLVYGIARAKTGSLYPSILMHAAMNLAVALA